MVRLAITVATVCAILWAAFEINTQIHPLRNTTITYALLLAILFFAMRWERLETMTAAVVAAIGFETFFQPPIGAFRIKEAEGWIAVVAFLITAIVVSHAALETRKRAAEANERRLETERLYQLGQALLASDSLQTTAWIVINQMVPIFGASAAAFYLQRTGETLRTGNAESPISEEDLRNAPSDGTQLTHAATGLRIVSIPMGEQTVGSLGVAGAALSETGLKSLAGLISVVLERVSAAEKLVIEKRTSESLLLNILPSGVADELRAKGMVSPKYFEDVTILFTDFVGFTLSTEKLAAEDLVEMLHDYFTAFDRIVAKYGLEKMKTIGDSYMCLSGLPQRNPAHPVDTVMAAFEMLDAVKARDRADGKVRWRVRIGIHTGPVIAGVVGINKFAFDIWGDTVNYSSRMESSGAPNRINLSERTYSRVKDFFDCEYRGKVLTKDKREVDMYFANGVAPALLEGPIDVAPAAFARRYHIYFQKQPPAFPAALLVQADAKRDAVAV